MELRHLKYFVAVAQEQSFTRAAEQLWIAQPGLSQQIRALERELGVQLLERHSRGVIVTEAGELFLDKARAALAAVDAALATGRDAAAGVLGHLRVGVGTHARCELGPKLLEAFRAQRPSVEVTVMEAHSETLLRDLRHDRLDAAVVLGPVRSTELQSACLREERVLVAVSESHPLAARTHIQAQDLHGETVVISGDRDASDYDQRVHELLATLGRASTHPQRRLRRRAAIARPHRRRHRATDPLRHRRRLWHRHAQPRTPHTIPLRPRLAQRHPITRAQRASSTSAAPPPPQTNSSYTPAPKHPQRPPTTPPPPSSAAQRDSRRARAQPRAARAQRAAARPHLLRPELLPRTQTRELSRHAAGCLGTGGARCAAALACSLQDHRRRL